MFSGEVQEVYETIKQKILERTYLPGQPLPEMALAEAYNIKRTRVRQILAALENDGLVEKLPAKGAFVKAITPEFLHALFETREALEPMAARLAARRRDDAELAELVALFETHEKTDQECGLEQKTDIGGVLHRFIRKSCGNDMIANYLEMIELQTRRVWREGLAIEGRINKAFEDHKKLLRFIENRDEESAEAFMRRHIAEASAEYLSVLFSM